MFRVAVSLLASLAFASAALGQPASPGVKDAAAMFRPDTVKKASGLIAAIAKKHKQVVQVETFIAVPKDQIAAVAKMNDTDKSNFFGAWARERMAALKTEGLHVLICRTPGYLQVTSGPGFEKVGFGDADIESLTGKYLAQAKLGKLDDGLMEALAFLDARLQFLKDSPPKRTSLGERLATVKFNQYATLQEPAFCLAWSRSGLRFGASGLMTLDADRKPVLIRAMTARSIYRKGNGDWVVIDAGMPAILEVKQDNQIFVLAEASKTTKLRPPGETTMDREGNLYWTEPGDPKSSKPDGRILRLRPDGGMAVFAQKLNQPTGAAIDIGSKNMFVIEAQGRSVVQLGLALSALKPIEKTTKFAEFEDFEARCCSFDANGNLWVAGAGKEQAAQIVVLSSAGKTIVRLAIPAKKATALAFGGEKNDEIFVATENPSAIYHAPIGLAGFAGHPGTKMKTLRKLPPASP